MVVLYAEVGSFIVGFLNVIAKQTGKPIHIIEWDEKNNPTKYISTKYIASNSELLEFYPRSKFDKFLILNWLKERSPSIVLVSGWMDKDYLWACRKYKSLSSEVKIVALIDNQWLGTLRQYVGSLYFRFSYKKIFDYMWVSGKSQYSFAQNFGYSQDKILCNLLSADTAIFNEKSKFSKRFVFVGRFEKRKGIDLLIDSYNKLSKETQNEWPLILIGDSELNNKMANVDNSNISIIPFLQPNELKNELLKGGVGFLPSYKDQWGLVVHEFALLGYPLILSSGVGSASEFLIPGYNGFMFTKGSSDSLHKALVEITKLSLKDLEKFSERSVMLGERINSEISAASILSVHFLEILR
jgi:glycosyltransferase involved in cell wall biosynthesis